MSETFTETLIRKQETKPCQRIDNNHEIFRKIHEFSLQTIYELDPSICVHGLCVLIHLYTNMLLFLSVWLAFGAFYNKSLIDRKDHVSQYTRDS